MRLTRSIPLVFGALACAASGTLASTAQANPVDPTIASQDERRPDRTQQDQSRLGTDAFGPMILGPSGLDEAGTADADRTPQANAEPVPSSDEPVAGQQPVQTQPSAREETANPVEPESPADLDGATGTTPESIDSATERSGAVGIPLGRPADRSIFGGDVDRAGPKDPNHGWILRTAGSLAVVIGLIVACRYAMQWLERRAGGASGFSTQAGSPSGLAEVLARYTVAKGTKLLLLKINARILVVSQTSEGMQTLSEITDPDEVASILIKTRDEEGASEASRFTQMLREMERDPSVAGEYGDFRSPRRALVESSLQGDEGMDESDAGEATSPADGATALRNRLSRLGDLSA